MDATGAPKLSSKTALAEAMDYCLKAVERR